MNTTENKDLLKWYHSLRMHGTDSGGDSREGLRQSTKKEEVEEIEMGLDMLFKTLLCQPLNVHAHVRIPEQRKNKGILRQHFLTVVLGCWKNLPMLTLFMVTLLCSCYEAPWTLTVKYLSVGRVQRRFLRRSKKNAKVSTLAIRAAENNERKIIVFTASCGLIRHLCSRSGLSHWQY